MQEKKIIKIAVIVILTVVLIDQLSKILITKFVSNKIGNDNFAIEVVENTGMAFGINSGNSENGKNIVLSVFVLFILFSFMKNQKNEIDTKTAIAISMVIGGGIGNVIDRIFRGGVLDFIKILFIPNFNFADFSICVGWILLGVFLVIYTRKTDKIEVIEDDKK